MYAWKDAVQFYGIPLPRHHRKVQVAEKIKSFEFKREDRNTNNSEKRRLSWNTIKQQPRTQSRLLRSTIKLLKRFCLLFPQLSFVCKCLYSTQIVWFSIWQLQRHKVHIFCQRNWRGTMKHNLRQQPTDNMPAP